MVRRVFLVVVLAAAASSATGLVYDTISAPSRLSADAPRNLDRPVLRRAGTVGDEVQFNPYELEWRSPVRGVPFQLRYSWLRCDLNGANCSPLAGLSGKTIAPPQEERIVTLRGVVTGTNRYGSRSVVTRNFYYDMAGLAFGVGDRRFVRNHLQYNPDQLRLTALFGHIGGLARRDRPSVVSDSWCEPCGGDGRRLPKLVREVVYPFVAGGCHLPHVVCVQAAGDHRIPGDPPSNSPYVLAVGGTEFKPTRDGAPSQEILWPFSGSGVTTIPLPRPPWQKHLHAGCSNTSGNFSCTKRAVPDVSATAASVPDFQPSRDGPDWFVFSGTSLSTPLWAGLLALADQQLLKDGQRPVGINELHQVLYRGDVSRGLDDIAPHGWDWDTGLGSPKSGIVPVLARAIEDYRAAH